MNFLFIMTDQLRPDHTGFGGNSIVQTPNLDRLAAQSRQFNRAYCPSPLCGPSRSSIFTGRMPSAHGNWLNMLGLDWDAKTFVSVLRKNGYRTALIGKSHLQEFASRREIQERRPNLPLDMPSLPELRRFKRYPITGVGNAVNRPWPEDWNKLEDMVRHREAYLKMPEDYYGFDTVELLCSHADLPEGHYRHWFVEHGGALDSMGGLDNAVEVSKEWRQVYCSNMPAELYPTSFVTERTLNTLDQFSQNDAPFFLNISYPDPHHPFCPPEPYYGMYADEKIPLPNTFYDPHENSLVHHQRTVAERGKDTIGPFLTSPSEAQYQAAAKAEYGSITMLDEGIGRILMRLDELGLAEKTTIIFCSDHGDMFGDHGLMLKFGCHYDGTVRVPFLFKTPHLQAGATNSLASLIDIAPTVLELAGCQPYVGIQGKSLKPILEDKNAVTRDTVFIEEDLPFDMLGVGQATSIRTLITQDTRLTVYAGATHGELFDLETDNSEIDNVYGSAEHSQLKSDMMTDLVHTMTVHHPIDRKV